ncbi:MAG: VWA domain-containing protein, partial [Acidimicrobiaceae bacterium]|nr:VWA domain-containing protein [Acidimicrobiaceae bacterium]MYE09606.1 VWA domain-containing protein [Acidimicrobiaceae bacterium]
METRGSGRFQTRKNWHVRWLCAVLALSLLAVACSGPGDDEADAAASAVADVGGDRADSGSETYAAPTTAASRSRTDDAMAEPEPDEEPMPEESADYAYAEAEATAAPAEAVAELEAAMAETEAASADASTSGVSRRTAAESDRERPEGRRRCSECRANTFEDYGVNPFVDPYDDNLSTFALDVDTASYVVTRNYLEGSQLPPIGAVRVEEFVNYFDGGYRTLIDEFNITLEAAPSPFSDPDRVMLRVGVQAPELLSDLVIPDTVVLVLDRSGSMSQSAGPADRPMERISLVHEAVELLLSGLPGSTRVGVVAYNDRAATILDPTEVSGNADWIVDEIRARVYPGGSTNAEAGLVRGYDMALREADRGRAVLVLLLSDGVANVGATRTDDILEEIGERGDIGLSTIGVGLGPFNDELMEQLANKADGTYHYIDTPSEARRIFVENLTSLLASVARDAKIQVEFDRD